jgi:hypothetical protein
MERSLVVLALLKHLHGRLTKHALHPALRKRGLSFRYSCDLEWCTDVVYRRAKKAARGPENRAAACAYRLCWRSTR